MTNVTVLVDDNHKDDLAKIARSLKKKGFVLTESLGGIGVLIGSVPDEKITALSAVPGVSAVEVNRTDYSPQQS